MAEFEDRHWTSEDGLRLHYRDYAGPGAGRQDKAPVICLPGLTRNARDFELLAERLAKRRRVLCLDLRGRGDSAYAKDPATYTPPTYVTDLEALLDQAGIARFVAVGTSLGGLVTMLLAGARPDRLTGAVFNDVGPEVSSVGIARIGGYVGQGRSFETWMHAARALEEGQGEMFPGFDIADWLTLAKRAMTLGSNGRIVFDYDMKIAEPFATPSNAAPPDLWPCWRALGGRPVLVLRGELSDILAPETAARMIAELPEAELVTLPRVGHAPTLDEPEAVAGIERLLDRAE
ncbi:alpha/beta fold hydrolase [Novosphingobium sp. Gsoil 351]|uniref:alpha/beta fold hydrolase n=1 Tax=Novosphingobium sp. Gsoil 351 TaxID=2675225 RepID=UPI0012B5001D|nr:alpha/beta hydrolase [Novosphingobium sp. Gsoil 351]QGN54382.1 alpha/beta fold hydrolase [Novosphingobium sp. Gsoil 351]